MLSQALNLNGSLVYVYKSKCSDECKLAYDLIVDELLFVLLENELWAVGYLEFGNFLIFDGLEFIKVEKN